MCPSSASAAAPGKSSWMACRSNEVRAVKSYVVKCHVVSGLSRAVMTVIAALLLAAPAFAQEAPSGDGSTPLHWAAYRDDLPKVDQLIRGGANVNAANDLGVTPLWAASLNGGVTLVKRLLD